MLFSVVSQSVALFRTPHFYQCFLGFQRSSTHLERFLLKSKAEAEFGKLQVRCFVVLRAVHISGVNLWTVASGEWDFVLNLALDEEGGGASPLSHASPQRCASPPRFIQKHPK